MDSDPPSGIGANMYAADRQKLVLPWRPAVDREPVKKQVTIAEKDEDFKDSGTLTEFNKLASLIVASTGDNFVLNLFPEQASYGSKFGGKDDDIILIDLSKQKKDDRV